jgi:autotransporter-associated beta strand protein
VQSFGVGTVVLSGSNSFSGRYIQTQSNATLVLNSGFALGGGGGIQLNPGAFSINNTSGASLTLAGNNNIYFGASGVGTGAQTLTFVGTNDLNLGSGTVVLANASKSISTTAGTLTIGSIDVSGVNSGTYGLTKNGAGTLAITGAAGAGYTGGLSLTTGILQVGNNTAIGTGTLSLANGTTLQAINGDVVLPNAWNFFATSGGAGFSGSQSLTLNGMGRYSANAGSAALTNNIDAGKVLTFQGGLDLYSGTAASAGTFTLQGTGNTTISGNLIQSTGSARSFTISNTGITTLSGSNTYMGTTTVSNGVLKLDSANALGGGNLTIGSSGLVGLGTGNSSFTRAAGSGTGQVQWNGGGFAAYGADATVDIGGVGASGTVNLVNNTIWSAATADSTVVFSNVANAATVAKTVTVNNGSAEVDARFTGPVVGSTASFTKAGAGTLEMTAASTYSGTVAITAGQLRFSGTGSLSGATGRVVVNGADAELKWNSSVALSRPITLTQGTLSGTGTIGTAVSVGSGAILSPGNSPGTQAFTSGLTWQVGGTYDWEINDASGTLGGNPGWDLLDVTSGTLNLASLTSSSQFNLDLITLNSLVSGSMANYTPGQPYTWQIVRTLAGRVVTPTGTATGGEDLTSLFNLVTTSWVSGPVPSSIQVKVSSGGTGLDLVIVPEPETVVLASIGAFMAGWSLWKRRRIAAICHPDSRA